MREKKEKELKLVQSVRFPDDPNGHKLLKKLDDDARKSTRTRSSQILYILKFYYGGQREE